MTDEQLVSLQTSKSDWHARRARIVLQHRASTGSLSRGAVAQLMKLFREEKNPDYRLRAMWALHITQGIPPEELEKALTDKDEYVRAWAMQMLCEDMNASKKALDAMVKMSRSDPSPVVRLYLAAALQRVDMDTRWNITTGLISQAKDIEDHNIPKMIWFGMEDLAEKDPARAMTLAASCKIPLIAAFTARRLVDANELNTLIADLGKRPPQLAAMLNGMLAGLEGRSDIKAPGNWEGVYATLRSEKAVAPLAEKVAQLFGDTEVAQKYLATLKSQSSSLEARREALKSLASRQRAELIPLLPALLDQPNLRVETIRAMAAYDHPPFAHLLVEGFDLYNTQERGEALQTLSSRPSYGRILTQAIKDEHIRKNQVPAYVARQLRRVVGNGFVEVWGPIDQPSGNKAVAYKRYQHLLTEQALATADLAKGRILFQRTCSACHSLYGEGGNLGPDITGSNRSNINYLLSNLIEPSGEIQDDYRMVVITSRDGRTYSGNIVAENDRQLTFRVIGQDQLVINKSDIQSQETAAVSMMPEGLIQTLTDKEVLDLIAYLRTSQQPF